MSIGIVLQGEQNLMIFAMKTFLVIGQHASAIFSASVLCEKIVLHERVDG